MAVFAIRKEIYVKLEVIRRLRNRIAHHEPIFTRNLIEEFGLMEELVRKRSQLAASWMVANQDAIRSISLPRLFRGGKLWRPTHDEVAEVAYFLWEDKGRMNGTAEQDWTDAERLLGLHW